MSSCKKCGAEIVWEKTQTGKFKPPMNPDRTPHKCGPEANSGFQPDPNDTQAKFEPNGKLVPDAEKRVRQIVQEELAKLFLNYQRANEK